MDGNFIFEIEDFISKELCEDIIQRFENEPLKFQGAIGGDLIDLERRNSSHRNMKYMKDCEHIKTKLQSKLTDALNVYNTEFCNYFKKYNENPKFIHHVTFSRRQYIINDFDVQRVAPKTHFRWHADGDGDGDYAHTCIIYLNDIDIKDGGATEFACGRKVQPKAGKILIFPGGWSNIHRGSFVHKPKYMITNAIYFTEQKRYEYPFCTFPRFQNTPIYLASNHESKPNRDSQNSTLVKVPES